MKKIDGGYILLARKFLKTGLMEKPPLWSKLFIWMLLRANRQDGYKGLKTGEFYTTIREMREAMTHYIGYRKVTPSPKQIRVIYEGLSGGIAGGIAKGIEKTINVKPLKGKAGLKITILNYTEYQNPKNYEGHRQKKPIKKNEGHSEKFTKDVCRAYLYSKQEDNKNNKKEIYKYISTGNIDFCVEFIFYISENYGNRSPKITESFINNSFVTLIDLTRLDGFDFEYVADTLRWGVTDKKFWEGKILSLSGLRKKNNGTLTKFQKITNSFEESKKKEQKPVNGRSEQNAKACSNFINKGKVA